MRGRPSSSPLRDRRGAALLLVLIIVTLLLPLLAAWVRGSATAHLQQTMALQSQLADELLPELEARFERWLRESADGIILPPEAEAPVVTVLAECLQGPGPEVSVSITAWDQHGLISLQEAQRPSPLAQSLPREVRAWAQRLPTNSLPDGHDAAWSHLLQQGPIPADVAAFPSVEISKWAHYRLESSVATSGVLTGDRDGTATGTPTALAGVIALAPKGHSIINVNTAPIDLVEAALRQSGRGGLEAIIAARREGQPAVVPPAPVEEDLDEFGRVQLVDTSSRWSARVEIIVGAVRRSWWITVERTASGWRRVHRLAITT